MSGRKPRRGESRRVRSSKVAAVALIAPFVLGAYGGRAASSPAVDDSSPPTDAAAAAAESFEEITMATTSPVDNLDYTSGSWPTTPVTQAASIASGGFLYSYLADGSIQPELAEDYPVLSEEDMTATFTLREGLVYSDGTPLEAADVVAAFDRVKAGPTAGSPGFDPFDSAEAPDERTVILHMNTFVDPMLDDRLLGHALNIHPRDRIDDPDYWNLPVSAGKFVIADDWVPGGPTMVLEANENYWRGTPAIQRLVLASSSDPTSRLLQVTSGEAQIAYDLPAGVLDTLPDDVESYAISLGGVWNVAFNSNFDSPVADLSVRQAICLAIDREEINQRAFFGTAPPTGALISRDRPEWDYVSILPNDGARDVEAAQALLEDAGYGDGFEMVLQTWGARPGNTDAAIVISENLADIGITASVEPYEDAVAISNFFDANFESQFIGAAGHVLTITGAWYGAGSPFVEATGFDNPEISAMVDELRTVSDRDEFQELTVEILTRGWEESAASCPLVERYVMMASRVPAETITGVAGHAAIWVGMANGS